MSLHQFLPRFRVTGLYRVGLQPGMSGNPGKLAVLFRYGAEEHLDFNPALPALVRNLSEHRISVHHFGFKEKKSPGKVLPAGLQVHRGPFSVRRGNPFDKVFKAVLWILYLPLLGLRLRREGFERVFVDETVPLSVGLIRLFYRGKIYLTVQDFFLQIYWEKHPVWALPARLIQEADFRSWRKLTGIFVRAGAAGEYLASKGVSGPPCFVVPDAVDMKRFSPCTDPEKRTEIRKSHGLETDSVVMVHHGIMHPNKGNVRLVEAMPDLIREVPGLKLLLIGDGPEMKSVRARVADLKLESAVILTGWLPGLKEIAELLSVCDIGLVIRKGQAADHFHVTSTLVHNLASGLPVVSVRLRGLEEVLSGTGAAVFCDPGCGEEFRQGVISLARNPEKRERMSSRAEELAGKLFDPENIARRYTELLLDS